ncbi:MAG TPA: YcxB family protein [Gammaproteobacteria bacterium]|nr:YcxB family protein [Gammaproteobacteria bacterium]
MMHKRWGVWMWILNCSTTGILAGYGAWLIYSSGPFLVPGVILMAWSVLLWVLIGIAKFVLIPVIARKRFKWQKRLQRPYNLSWNKDTFYMKGEHGESHTSWSDFSKWRESKHMILVYITDGLFRLIPKRAFKDSSAVTDFSQILYDKIGPCS